MHSLTPLAFLILRSTYATFQRLPASDQLSDRDAFLDGLVSNMTVPELVHQLHIMFADNVIGPKSQNELYDFALGDFPDAGVGVIHDWYPTNSSQYNDLQRLNIERSRIPIPMMQTGECLHGVGSFKQSMFPQAIALASTFDTELVYQVGRAIGSEARAIGIHACFSPVLDLGRDPRWGRVQEDFGEDVVLTSHIGVAYSRGLSKNGSWADKDAVVPVMKHFAGHGSPRSGLNTAPSMIGGMREVLTEILVPFKAAVQLGGVRGVMMAYSELDGIPCHVNPLLYEALDQWGFDGFVIADDTGMRELRTGHFVAPSDSDAILQWLNAGGQLQFYDYPLATYRQIITDLVKNGTLPTSTLRKRVRRVLGVKYDLGLFKDPSIPDGNDVAALTSSNIPLTLEAAKHSIVLLENRNHTLPLLNLRVETLQPTSPITSARRKIAVIGPFGDILNFGDYSGPFGSSPAGNANTLLQSLREYAAVNTSNHLEVLSSWGANTWSYNGQYPIAPYLLSTPNGTAGGLLATYYYDVGFKNKVFEKQEVPNLDWGLYPPNGLPSNNFSVVWEGQVSVPISGPDIEGWIGVAISANCSARLFVDGRMVSNIPSTLSGNILGNIPDRTFSLQNGTSPPPGGATFTFKEGSTHSLRIEFRAFNTFQKLENVNSVNSHIELFWNLVDRRDPIGKAISVAHQAELIILAVGAAWNSDGENGDRATLGLSPDQTRLADAILSLRKPVVLVISGGRPFAIPEYYSQAAAVLQTFFLGQSGGRAISDVLVGNHNPGGRLPLSIPVHVGQLPVYYSFKPTAHLANYVDIPSLPQYSFGYGLSYSIFSRRNFRVASPGNKFTSKDTLRFQMEISNQGPFRGSDVPQVYLLRRFSSVTQPNKRLVAFGKVHLQPGEEKTITLEVDVERYLSIINRNGEWEVEGGDYTFALLDHSGDADTSENITLISMG